MEILDFISTVAFLFSVKLLYAARVRKKRKQTCLLQRDAYFKNLAEESSKMEQQKLAEEQELTQRIEEVDREIDRISNKIEKIAKSNGIECDLKSFDGRTKDKLQQELDNLKRKSDQLQSVDNDINQLCQNIGDELNGRENSIHTLNESIRQLEAENEELKSQIETNNCFTMPKRLSDLEPDLLNYLEEHIEDLSLDFLKKAYDTLLEIKASNPSVSFQEYTKEIKKNHSTYDMELTDLQVAEKRVEKKLDQSRHLYEEELNSFKEVRIEHIFKNTGAKGYLERLKEINDIDEEILQRRKSIKEETGIIDY